MNLFNGIFWGALFILAGLLFIMKNYVNINISVFRLIFGLILLYVGFRVIFGGFVGKGKSDVMFDEKNIKYTTQNNEYNIVFGKGIVDLTNIKLEGESKKIEVNAIFGSAEVTIPSNVPVVIVAGTAFGSVETPGNASHFIGDHKFISTSYKEGEPFVKLEANAVFGSVDILERIIVTEEAETVAPEPEEKPEE